MNCYEEYDKDGKLIYCKTIDGDEYKFNNKGKIIYYKKGSTGDTNIYFYDEDKLIEKKI